jgi:hypothetical protein
VGWCGMGDSGEVVASRHVVVVVGVGFVVVGVVVDMVGGVGRVVVVVGSEWWG